MVQVWFQDTWAPDEHYIPTLVRVSVDSHLHVLQVQFRIWIPVLWSVLDSSPPPSPSSVLVGLI